MIDKELLSRIESIEERLSRLENKQPTYVPPPVYGPIRRQCRICGSILHGSESHSCSKSDKVILENK